MEPSNGGTCEATVHVIERGVPGSAGEEQPGFELMRPTHVIDEVVNVRLSLVKGGRANGGCRAVASQHQDTGTRNQPTRYICVFVDADLRTGEAITRQSFKRGVRRGPVVEGEHDLGADIF